MEERLVKLLRRVALHFEGDITLDTPLTEDGLGLDSLTLATLLGELEDEFSIRLTERDIAVETFETVGRLLRLVEARVDAAAPPAGRRAVGLLKTVQRGGDRTPLIVVNGDVYGDGALYCVALAQRLGSDRPVYSLSSHGTDGGAIPPSIEAMAADHSHTIRAAIGASSYVIAGYSHGALVALEAARRLTDAGHRVPHVFLIDMLASSTRERVAGSTVAPYRALPVRAARLARRSVASLVRSASGRWRIGQPAASVPVPDAGGRDIWRRRQWDAYAGIVRAYVPRPYPGRLTIAVARHGHYRRATADPTLGWAGVAETARAVVVPGDHLTCVTRHTAALARQLCPILSDADRP